MPKMNTDILNKHYMKFNSKWIIDINVKCKIIAFSRRAKIFIDISEEDKRIENKHMERCSIPLIRKMQVKTTVNNFYTPIAIIKIYMYFNLKVPNAGEESE